MVKARGRQFDPQIFDTFMDVLPLLRELRHDLEAEVEVDSRLVSPETIPR